MKDDQAEYERRVSFYESEGLCRSDAQATVDAEMLTESCRSVYGLGNKQEVTSEWN